MAKDRKDFDEIDIVAEQMFDYACANRQDNLNKDGTAGDPRKIACEYKDLIDPAMRFYRHLAQFCLNYPENYLHGIILKTDSNKVLDFIKCRWCEKQPKDEVNKFIETVIKFNEMRGNNCCTCR